MEKRRESEENNSGNSACNSQAFIINFKLNKPIAKTLPFKFARSSLQFFLIYVLAISIVDGETLLRTLAGFKIIDQYLHMKT